MSIYNEMIERSALLISWLIINRPRNSFILSISRPIY